MLELYTRLAGYLQKERGQTMAEYAVVLAVIAVVVVAALELLAGGIGDTLGNVTETLNG
jgi:Flp pilus assembly pilin Flp